MVRNQTVVDKLVEVNALLQQLDRKSEGLREVADDGEIDAELKKLQQCLVEARRAISMIRSRCNRT